MAAAIRKGAALLAVPALMGVFAGTAAADPSPTGEVGTTPADPAPFADCAPGWACFYTGPNGTGQVCSWQFADSNHAAEPGGVCPWAADTAVLSIWNNGVSPEFAGLCSYEHAGYTDRRVFIAQGDRRNISVNDFKVMSHKWVRPGVSC